MKHIETILKKQCELVGADYDKIDFKKNNWWMEYEWDEDTRNEFLAWMRDYLYENKEARQEIMMFTRKNKKNCLRAAQEWDFMYGWKMKVK